MSDPSNRMPEAEIIPPGAPLPGGSRVWMTDEAQGGQRVTVRPISPLGLALLAVGIGAVTAVALVFLLGIAFFGLVAIGVLTLAGIIAGLLRGPSRPLR
jgi:hypothetical protein